MGDEKSVLKRAFISNEPSFSIDMSADDDISEVSRRSAARSRLISFNTKLVGEVSSGNDG